MERWKNKVIKNTFIRNVVTLATGTAAAQGIALVSSPIITRLYGPEAYGIMGVFMSIAGIFIPIAALTYPIAIVLPKDDRNAKGLFKLSLYSSFGLATLIALILLIFNESILDLFNIQEISFYIFLIPLIIIFSGLMQGLDQWLIRTKQFGINAKATFFQSLIINGTKIGTGLVNPIASILIILSTFANGLKALMMALFFKKTKYKRSIFVEETPLTTITLLKRYKDFPLFRAPEVLINSISERLPVLLLTAFFGPATAGFYTIGVTVLQQPIKLIGDSVGNVFYPRISEAAHNKENLAKLIIKATFALGAIGLIPFGLIIFFGPQIFGFIFGSDWITAGKYAQWIAIYLYFEFINKPSIRSLPVLSAQLFHLFFTIISMVVRITALVIGYYTFESDLVAISLFSIFSAVMHFILVILVLKKSKNFNKGY